jgi:ribonuclease Z
MTNTDTKSTDTQTTNAVHTLPTLAYLGGTQAMPLALAAASGLSIERATIALEAAHTSPKAAGKVFSLVQPRLACLWHTLLSPEVIAMLFAELGEVYQGPVLQTQDLTVINITKDAIVSRQAQVQDQLPPIAGEQRSTFTPTQIPPPAWWAEALIPLN